MPARKSKPETNPDNPEEYRRFVELAREVGADASPGATDKAFARVFGPSSTEADVRASIGRLRAEMADAERKLAKGGDPAELRRLRVRIRQLRQLVG